MSLLSGNLSVGYNSKSLLRNILCSHPVITYEIIPGIQQSPPPCTVTPSSDVLVICFVSRTRLELMRHIYNEDLVTSPLTPEQNAEDFFHCLNQPFTLANLLPSRLVWLTNVEPYTLSVSPLYLSFATRFRA